MCDSAEVVGNIDLVFAVPYPRVYLDMLSWFALLELDLFEFLPLSCAFPMNFYYTLVVRTALPIVVLVALAAAGRLLKESQAARSDATVDILGELGVGSSCYSWCFFLIFLLYPGCAFTAFSTFICSTLDDGTRYLSRDASLDCDDPMHTLMEGYAAVMIVIWPVGVPLLYTFCFWLEWPTISRLRRREMREESNKSLQVARRGSASERRLLEGELTVSLQVLANLEDDEGDGGGPDLKQWASLKEPICCQVHLIAGAILVEHTDMEKPLMLTLTPQSEPQLFASRQVLFISGEVAVADGREQRAKLTLEPPGGNTSRSGGSTLRRTLRSISEGGGMLREWEVAVLGQVPEADEIDMEMTLKKHYLTPILQPFELRCFW